MKKLWLKIHGRLIRLVVGNRPVMMNVQFNGGKIYSSKNKDIYVHRINTHSEEYYPNTRCATFGEIIVVEEITDKELDKIIIQLPLNDDDKELLMSKNRRQLFFNGQRRFPLNSDPIGDAVKKTFDK